MGEQLNLFERQAPADIDEGDSRTLPGSIPLPRVQFSSCQHPDEHPAERLRRCGPRSLTDSEVLSLILRSDELESIRDLLDEIGLVGLAQLDQDFFYQSVWDEPRTASLIAAVELARRLARIRIPERQLLERPDYVANYLTLRYQGDQEVLGALYLDSRRRLIAEREIFRGTLDRATAEPRDVLKPALLFGAKGFILFHTHPSGNPAPSSDDLAFTRRLAEAAEYLGVEMLDHLILGTAGRWVSLRARGSW